MKIRRRFRFLRVFALLIVASTLITGCDIFAPKKAEPTGASSVSVKSGKDVVLTPAGGAPEVYILGGSIVGDGALSVEPVEGPDGTTGWSIELKGAELKGEAKLRFKNAIKSGEPAPLIGFSEKEGDAINYEVKSVAVGSDIEVTTTHFSTWYAVSWDWLKNWTKGRIDAMLSTTAGETPTCSKTKEAKAKGIKVTSSESNRAKWCIGLDKGGKTILKVSNNRGYGVTIESTPGLKLTRRDTSIGLKFQHAVGKVGAFPGAKGNNVDIAAPGELVEYTLSSTPKEQEGINIKPSPSAFAATALWFAGETATMVWGKLKNGDENKISKSVETAMNAVDCVAGLRGMAAANVMDAEASGNYFQGAMETVTPCVSQILKKLAGDNFLDNLAVDVLGVFTWLTSGIKAIFQSGRAIADTVFGGGKYQIIVSSPAPVVTNYCTENQLRKARDIAGDEWLLEPDPSGERLFYDAFTIHGCKSGFALVEASHSSGSAFDYWALMLDKGTWRLVTNSSLGLGSPPEQFIFNVDDVSDGFGKLGVSSPFDTAVNYFEAVGWQTKNGRDTVGAFDW